MNEQNNQNNNLNNMFSSTNNILNTNNQTNIPNPGINNDAISFDLPSTNNVDNINSNNNLNTVPHTNGFNMNTNASVPTNDFNIMNNNINQGFTSEPNLNNNINIPNPNFNVRNNNVYQNINSNKKEETQNNANTNMSPVVPIRKYLKYMLFPHIFPCLVGILSFIFPIAIFISPFVFVISYIIWLIMLINKAMDKKDKSLSNFSKAELIIIVGFLTLFCIVLIFNIVYLKEKSTDIPNSIIPYYDTNISTDM